MRNFEIARIYYIKITFIINRSFKVNFIPNCNLSQKAPEMSEAQKENLKEKDYFTMTLFTSPSEVFTR